jgi:hypothetical protein
VQPMKERMKKSKKFKKKMRKEKLSLEHRDGDWESNWKSVNTDQQPTVPEENTHKQPTVQEDNTDKQPKYQRRILTSNQQ